MSCKCNDNDEGCAPLPVVSKGSRTLVRGADGCPAELSGSGVITQSTGGGVTAATGTADSPVCFGDIQSGVTLDALLGVKISDITGVTNCVFKLKGTGEDAGKVLKWSGTAFELRSLLETLCYPADVVQGTCCPTSLAVWGQSGDSLCLQQWDPCSSDGRRNVTNPSFVVCEGGRISPLQLCDLPTLTEGTSYQQVVCTEDGPRVLGSGGVSSRQFVPIDVVPGAGAVLQDTITYDQSNGTAVTNTVDLVLATGVAIPTGATHVQVGAILTLDNESNAGSADINYYSPPVELPANLRATLWAGDNDSDEGSVTAYYTIPITSGGFSWLMKKTGASNSWISSVFLRIEGYWVG
jgi:hypothetical protein